MNLDTGVAVNTFPLNFGPEGAGGRFLSNSQCCVDGGAWQFQGYDENGLCRSLNGRLAGVHKVLCVAGEIASKGRQDLYLGADGGFMILVHSKIGHDMRMHFERLVIPYEKKTHHSSVHREVKSTETTLVNHSQLPGNDCGRAVHSQVRRQF